MSNDKSRPPLSSRRRPSAGVVVAVALLSIVASFIFFRGGNHPVSGVSGVSSSSAPSSTPGSAVQAFTVAWNKGDLSTVSYSEGLAGTDVQAEYKAITKSLQPQSVQVAAQRVQPTADDRVSQSVLTVDWRLPGDQAWKYQSSVQVIEVDGKWQVIWNPSIVHPALGNGDALRYTRIQGKRATILDGVGQPLIANRMVVDVGLEAGKVGDATATGTQLAAILGVNGPALATRIKGAPADQFVDVITLRQADFDRVSAQVNAVQGIVLRNLTLPLSPSHDFARAFLGTIGPVTKEMVDASKGRYVAGDTAGLGGLEKDFDSTIGGTAGFQIDVIRQSGGGSAAAPNVLLKQPAVDGVSLRTTLDQRVQTAADLAVGTVTDQPSALVAVRVSTGRVIAVANGPSGGGFDTALLGAVPPGSSFKIVTTLALLQQGLEVNSPVACSPQIVVQGKTFHNYEGEQLGSVPFHTDFAQSCNTAFASLSSKVPGGTLSDTASALGIGACWSLGTEAFRGKVAPPKDLVDLAATSFGQGSTLVSPVSLAVAVGTIARGSYLAPQLVLNGTPQGCATAAAPAPLSPGAIAQLRALMREVVTVGTGVVLDKAPGGPVMAKTGTAEYGPGNPPKTHAWLVGYQRDIAFAVYVQDGQSGGTVAAPVALKFLQNLAAK